MAISDNLFSTIKDDILTGKLKSGEKLTEKVICNQYSISRTPVREALQKLEMEGLVESIPNRGFFVLGLTARDYEDMFTLRKLYEIQAFTWAVERASDQERESIEELFELMEFYTMKKDVAKMLTINMNFHQMIYKASHNRILANLLSSYQQMLKYVDNTRKNYNNYLLDVFTEHKAIYEAFNSRDVDAGVTAITTHLENSKLRYLKSIKLL